MTFAEHIAAIERELLALKSAQERSASTLKTTTKSVTLSIPLKLDSASGSSYGTKMGIVRVGATNASFLSQMTIDNIQSGRKYSVTRRPSDGDSLEFVFVITAGNTDDTNRLSRGESVTANEGVAITATSDFTTTITYEDFE